MTSPIYTCLLQCFSFQNRSDLVYHKLERVRIFGFHDYGVAFRVYSVFVLLFGHLRLNFYRNVHTSSDRGGAPYLSRATPDNYLVSILTRSCCFPRIVETKDFSIAVASCLLLRHPALYRLRILVLWETDIPSISGNTVPVAIVLPD